MASNRSLACHHDREIKLAQILMSLDRCVHGRHQKDNCFDCPVNEGNPYLEPGQRIGTTLYGAAIVVPRWDLLSDPAAWDRGVNYNDK